MTSTVPHQALYRRWRAQTFSQIVGQEAVVETLRNAVRTGPRLARDPVRRPARHGQDVASPGSWPRPSTARTCRTATRATRATPASPIREGTTLDVLEIDAASNRGINEVRDLRDRLAYPPGHLRRKVYILDEAHQITKDAWNALLKSLEEPPDFVIFLFASTEPSGFPPAILSRLQRYDVRRLTVARDRGQARAHPRGRRPDRSSPTRCTLIARLAAGGMRDAESILDQLLSTTTDAITEAAVRELLGLADAAAVDGFLDALIDGDVAAGMAILDRLEERGRDPRALLDQVVDAVRARLVAEAAAPDRGDTDRWPRSPAASSPSTPTAPASAACASSSSSPCSRSRRRRRTVRGGSLTVAGRARARADARRPDPATEPRQPLRPALDRAAKATPAAADAAAPADAEPTRRHPTRASRPARRHRCDRRRAARRAPQPRRRRLDGRRRPPSRRRRPRRPAEQPTAAAPSRAATAATPRPGRSRRAGRDDRTPTRRAQPRAARRGVAGHRRDAEPAAGHQAAHPHLPAGRPRRRRSSRLGFPEEQAFLRDVAERKKADIEAGVGPGHRARRRRPLRRRQHRDRAAAGRRRRLSPGRGAPHLRRGPGRRRRGQLTAVHRGAPASHRSDWGDSTRGGSRDGHGQPAADGPADAAGDAARPGASSTRPRSTARPAAASSARPSPASRSWSASRSIPRRSTPTTSRCSRTWSSPPSTTRSRASRELAEQKMAAVTGGLRIPGM